MLLGDVQFVEAIGAPPAGSPFTLERYTNCVVFSTQGERSVPSMLAGGDLDGKLLNLPRLLTTANLVPQVMNTILYSILASFHGRLAIHQHYTRQSPQRHWTGPALPKISRIGSRII